MRLVSGFATSSEMPALRGCAVALGSFDGLHLGHQALFARAQELARSRGALAVAATFEPHPGKVLAPERAPLLLTPIARKLELMACAGLDAVILQPFDLDYARLGAGEFLARDLFGSLAPSAVVVGRDFTFGRGREGNVELMARACRARGVSLIVEAPVTRAGVHLSSTRVRALVAKGDVEEAARMLGRPHELIGIVQHGAGRGKGLGYPTANLACETEALPAPGVYAVRSWLGGRCFGGAASVGFNPTFDGKELSVEVFIFDLERNLYGERLSVELIARLRGEERFPSVSALVAQIGRDCEKARALLASAPPPGPLSPGCSARLPPSL